MATPLIVSEAEAGQKLLAYLQRRLGTPPSCAHRWIRTGQVRLNGKRCKPFDRVAAGDAVRLPPAAFAESAALPGLPGQFSQFSQACQPGEPGVANGTSLPRQSGLAVLTSGVSSDAHNVPSLPFSSPALPLPPLVFSGNGVAVYNKPAGLPVQPGTGHTDSLSTRLAAHFAGCDFVPAPAHRLDRDTTGLLAVGCTYAALRRLQEAFAGTGPLRKEYLCWVHGACPWEQPKSLEDQMIKSGESGRERMQTGSCEGRVARLAARCIEQRYMDGQPFSLLHITLMTGRTHQIRVQLASRGFPLAGDGKYGHAQASPRVAWLLLHAFRLGVDGICHEVKPPWPPPWDVADLPSSYAVDAALFGKQPLK